MPRVTRMAYDPFDASAVIALDAVVPASPDTVPDPGRR